MNELKNRNFNGERLLDVLAILAEDGAFQATQRELAEIQAQRDFELLERQPGKDRICSIPW